MSNIDATTYQDAMAVTVSDSVDDPAGAFAGLLVCTAGNVKFTSRSGTVTVTGAIAGQVIPVWTKRVWSTGTTSTVVGLTAPPYFGKVVGS